jgi:hypothetical protein
MKQRYLWGALLAAYLPAAGAVDFNTDALKSMQEEGHKIVEEEKGLRTFSLAGGKCLEASGEPGKPGANLVVKSCNAKSDSQKWRFDDQGRLVSHGGTCVGVSGEAGKPGANAVMQKCGGAKSQQWQHDGKKRLVNGLKKCLQAAGDPKKPGPNVVTDACGDSPNQVWK